MFAPSLLPLCTTVLRAGANTCQNIQKKIFEIVMKATQMEKRAVKIKKPARMKEDHKL
jgi:hypothetical protein